MMKFVFFFCLYLHAASLKINTKTQDWRLATSATTSNETDETMALLTKFVASHGGSARILLIGDSTMAGMVGHIPKITGLHIDFLGNKGCLHDKPFNQLLDPPPTAIMANIGLHTLHMHPALTCRDGADHHLKFLEENAYSNPLQAYLVGQGNKNCGAYESVVKDFAETMTKQSPTSKIFWRTTNSICTDVFEGAFKSSLEKWSNPETRPVMEKQCRQMCPSRYVDPERICGDEIYSRHASLLQHDTALKVLRDYPSIKILDAFKVTDGHCDLTTPTDGRHYKPLDPLLLLEFAKML